MIKVNLNVAQIEGSPEMIASELNTLFEAIFDNEEKKVKDLLIMAVSVALGASLKRNNIALDDFFKSVEENTKEFEKMSGKRIDDKHESLLKLIEKIADILDIDLDDNKDDSDD